MWAFRPRCRGLAATLKLAHSRRTHRKTTAEKGTENPGAVHSSYLNICHHLIEILVLIYCWHYQHLFVSTPNYSHSLRCYAKEVEGTFWPCGPKGLVLALSHSKCAGDTAAAQVSVLPIVALPACCSRNNLCVCLWLSAGGVGWWQPLVHLGVGLALVHRCLYVWVDMYIVTMSGFSKF